MYSAVLLKDGHYFALLAPTTAELEILWIEVAEKPLDFTEVQHVAVIRHSREDEKKIVKQDLDKIHRSWCRASRGSGPCDCGAST